MPDPHCGLHNARPVDCFPLHHLPPHEHDFKLVRRAQVRLTTCACGKTEVVEETVNGPRP